MFRLVCILIGYVFGLFQTAFIVGKIKGIDIREHGSGNAGTTNTMRVLGTKSGLIVFLGDCLKCLFAVIICGLIFKNSQPDAKYLIKVYAALGAIIGHNFPFYLNFKGGKGVACTAGFMFGFDGWFTLVGLIEFFSLFLTTHYVSLGSLFVYPYVLIMEIIMGQNGYFKGYLGNVVPQNYLTEMYIVTFCLLLLTTFMHRANIKRLLTHTEKKTYLLTKNKEKYQAELAAQNKDK